VALLAHQASDFTQQTADELATNEEWMRQLEVEQADLQGRYAALEGENQRLGTLVEQQRNDLADSETACDRSVRRKASQRAIAGPSLLRTIASKLIWNQGNRPSLR